MKFRPAFALLLAFVLPGCCNLKQGRVVAKGAHLGAPAVNTSAQLGSALAPAPDLLYRAPLPDVYWVKVEGVNAKGRTVRCDVILFKKDWQRLSVGDCWSAAGGARGGEGKQYKAPAYKETVPAL